MKLALGTVQFGLDYGVSNYNGKTIDDQALKILNYAWHNGIDTLDTARTYGDSEKIIGRVSNKYKWNIITKTPSFTGEEISKEQLKLLDTSFNKSLSDLHRESVDTLLVHSADDLLKPGGIKLFEKITRLKESGLINNIGVSVYNYKQIDYLLDHYKVDIIQLPINILDQRLIRSGHLKKIKKYGVEIHARSVFLQGLLLMSIDNIPPYFFPIKKKLENFIKKTKELSMSRLELALAFVQSIDEIDKVIVGVNTLEQLSEVINASRTQIRFSEFSDLAVDNQDFIDPTRWRV